MPTVHRPRVEQQPPGSSRAKRSAWWQSSIVAACAVVGIVGSMLGIVLIASSTFAQAATPALLSMNVTPAQNVTTGQALTLTITRTQAGTTAGIEITVAATAWCAPGMTFSRFPSGTVGYPNGFPIRPGQICTTYTNPTLNGALLPVDTISPQVKSTRNYTSASGTVLAEVTDGKQLRYGVVACDATHPCTLVAAVWVSDPTHPSTAGVYFVGTRVTFVATSVNTSCGGSAPGQLRTASPDRLGHLMSIWTLGACNKAIGGGKALSSKFVGRRWGREGALHIRRRLGGCRIQRHRLRRCLVAVQPRELLRVQNPIALTLPSQLR